MKKYLLVTFLSMLSVAGFCATFTSSASGSWSAPGTWTIVGVDADGIPDNNDDVTIAGSFTVTLTVANNSVRNFTINSGTLSLGGSALRFYGNVLKTGGTISGVGSWLFYSANGTIQGLFVNQGNWYFTLGAHISIVAGSTIQKNNGFTIYQNAEVINNGTVRLTGGSITFNHASARWVNAANSTLQVADDFVGSGVLDFTAVPNTMVYHSSSVAQVRGLTYHHLRIQNSGTTVPFLTQNLTVNGDMTLTATTFNWNNRDINLAGNWINNANTTGTNMGTITFSGSGTQTITRATGNTEVFAAVNLSGSGTVLLQDSLRVNGLLNIGSGTLDVNTNNYSVRCLGDFMDNSVFNARQGTVFMVGSAAQTIDGFATTTFYNLTCSNAAGVSVNFTKQISNILTVSAGAFGPSGFGSIILTATGSTSCARIAPLGATGSLSGGSWSIQTYIDGPATAYWQYLTSPVQATTLNDWDSDTRFYMSGVGGNDGNACCPVFQSVRVYNQATNTYSNVTSINSTLTPGRGYMVWMADNLNSLTAPLIFDTRGVPNSGTVNRAVTAGGAGGGYNLVGNPLPCPVNYSAVQAASSASLSGNFVILQENGSYATNPNSGTIAGAQGFMCVAATAGNITFTEACKSTTATPNMLREIGGNEIRIKAGNTVNGLGEETVIQLNPAGSELYDFNMDLPYLPSPYDNATHIYTNNSVGEQFILNDINSSDDHLMVPVTVVTSTPGTQLLTFKNLNTVTEYNCAWLEDVATGERINLNQYDTYQFEESEMGATRNFILHLERTSDCSFELQSTVASLDASTNVYVSGSQIFAQFDFETEEVVTVSMFDLSGRMVMGETTMNVSKQTVALETPEAHGVYLVRIQKGNDVSTKKIYY